MIRDDNNLKDTSLSANTSHFPMSFDLSYTKTNKLITALYMVTDVMDVNEPIRHKLRFLGGEVISDINYLKFSNRTDKQTETVRKISEIVSFLDIANAVFMISTMNAGILKKEFVELQKSLEGGANKTNWLTDFLTEGTSLPSTETVGKESIRVGVQKGSTLLKAIKDIKMSNRMSDKTLVMSDRNLSAPVKDKNHDDLKNKRREEIITIIKNNNGVATISDIVMKATGVLKSCGEKTLQRELVSMVGDGVLYKEGEKRWSRYLLK